MINDLCGKRIGKLVVLEKIQKTNKKNGCTYLCKCDCGIEKNINSSALLSKNVASCGCSYFKDITGFVFTNWTVLEKVTNDSSLKKQEVKWRCQCKCGTINIVFGKTLKNKTSKSCGCLIDDIGPNLINKIFGELKVLSKTKEKILSYKDAKWKRRAWECLCKCGTVKTITENKLLSGKYISCGCMQISKNYEQYSLANEKRRKYSPSHASARNVYLRCYNDGDISFDQFLILTQKNCFYCNAAPSNCANKFKTTKSISKRPKINGEFIYNGLDRIDSNKKHMLNNVVASCKTCNYAKRQMTLIEFYSWIEKVYNIINKNGGKLA